MEGWVKLHRRMVDWEWYKDSKMVHLLLHLIMSANHKDGKYQGKDVKRGQLITGRIELSAKTGISEQSVRTCLEKLKNSKEVTIKTTNKNSVITIINYDLYQSNENTNQQDNQQLTSNQPATNQQLTTNNNDKNDKNDKNDNKTFSFEVMTVYDSVISLFPIKPQTAKDQNKWKDEIRKLIEIDKHDPPEIIEVITWARNDSFWSEHFLSVRKLRSKNKDEITYYDVFKLKSNSKAKQNGKPTDTAKLDEITRLIKNGARI